MNVATFYCWNDAFLNFSLGQWFSCFESAYFRVKHTTGDNCLWNVCEIRYCYPWHFHEIWHFFQNPREIGWALDVWFCCSSPTTPYLSTIWDIDQCNCLWISYLQLFHFGFIFTLNLANATIFSKLWRVTWHVMYDNVITAMWHVVSVSCTLCRVGAYLQVVVHLIQSLWMVKSSVQDSATTRTYSQELAWQWCWVKRGKYLKKCSWELLVYVTHITYCLCLAYTSRVYYQSYCMQFNIGFLPVLIYPAYVPHSWHLHHVMNVGSTTNLMQAIITERKRVLLKWSQGCACLEDHALNFVRLG